MRARWFISVVVVAGAMALAACGGDDDSDNDTDTDTSDEDTPASEATRRPTRTPTTVALKPPADVCALVTADEPKMFAAEIGAPRSIGHDTTPNTSVGCRWSSSGTGASFGSLTVEVYTPAAIGRTPETIKAALEMRSVGREEIPGVGEFALIWGNSSTVRANAIVKGVVVRVEWSGGAPAAKRDTVIALLKLVVGRIP